MSRNTILEKIPYGEKSLDEVEATREIELANKIMNGQDSLDQTISYIALSSQLEAAEMAFCLLKYAHPDITVNEYEMGVVEAALSDEYAGGD